MNSNSGFRIAPFGRGGNVKFLIKVLCCAFALLLLVTASVAAADTLSGISAENFFLLNPEKTAGHVWQQSRFAQADINKTAAVSKSSEKGPTGYTTAQINEMTNNPLGELWMLWMQNDSVWLDGDALDKLGEHSKRFNTVTLEPILPLQLTKEWKLIFRPVIPIASYDVPDSVSLGPPSHIGGLPSVDADWDRKTGLGDIVLWNALAKNEWTKPPSIFGFGPTFMLPTATDDDLGTEKWSAGPMGLAFHVGPPGGFIFGSVVQHWWSFAGSDNRKDVNMTNIQYVAYYRYSASTNIGFGPNIVANWENGSDDVWSIPVGGGFNTTVWIGPAPVKVGMEFYYYVEKPDEFGPEWQLRMTFTPIMPKPAWSKKPLFGF
jgi:hypothetical protein